MQRADGLILATAQRMFAEMGYARTTIRALAARAGVNLAAINYHFFDKPNLYRRVIADCLAQIEVKEVTCTGVAMSEAGTLCRASLVRLLAWEIVQPSGQRAMLEKLRASQQPGPTHDPSLWMLLDLAILANAPTARTR